MFFLSFLDAFFNFFITKTPAKDLDEEIWPLMMKNEF